MNYLKVKSIKSRLCVTSAHTLLYHIRNMKKVSFRKRFTVVFLLFAIPVTIIYTLTKSKFVCVEFLLKSQADSLCQKYRLREVTGDFCPILCSQDEVTKFKCLSQTSGKSTFLAQWKNQYIVIKTTASLPSNQFVEPLVWHDVQGDSHYPTDDEFTRMIQRAAFFRYNTSLSVDKIQAMIKFTNGPDRGKQMNDMWNMIQQNDYFMGIVFAAQEIFPEILGSCGSWFALEHVEPINRERRRGINAMTLADWRSRIKAAVLILDYLKELDANTQDPIKLCDFKINNFGISGNKLMKYSDLKGAYVESYLDAMIGNAKACTQDVHCSYHQCKSVCNMKLQKCMDKQLNNNLQIVCEKLFQGTSHWPGLLMTNRTPKSLHTILDECVNPQDYKDHDIVRQFAASDTIREKLYDELTRLYEESLAISGI